MLPRVQHRWDATPANGTVSVRRMSVNEIYAQATEDARQASPEILAGRRGAADARMGSGRPADRGGRCDPKLRAAAGGRRIQAGSARAMGTYAHTVANRPETLSRLKAPHINPPEPPTRRLQVLRSAGKALVVLVVAVVEYRAARRRAIQAAARDAATRLSALADRTRPSAEHLDNDGSPLCLSQAWSSQGYAGSWSREARRCPSTP